METMTDFILLGSKITADSDCSHEIKRCLLLGRKAITNLDSILQSRDITLLTKVCLIKAMVILVVMYGCESWSIKRAEHERIGAFELWCWSHFPLNCDHVSPQGSGLNTGGQTVEQQELYILTIPAFMNMDLHEHSSDSKPQRKFRTSSILSPHPRHGYHLSFPTVFGGQIWLQDFPTL